MIIPSPYNFNPKIVLFLQNIEAQRCLLDYILNNKIEESKKDFKNFRFKRAFFTLVLEGEKISFLKYTLENLNIEQNSKIWNMLNIYKWIKDTYVFNRKLKKEDILYLHRLLMQGNERGKEAGVFRKVQELKLQFSNEAIYAHSAPEKIEEDMFRLVEYINSEVEQFVPIKASLALFTLIKISPFLEGNGILSRLLFYLVMCRENYNFLNTISFEETLYRHKEEFKHLLEREDDTEGYLEFMLETLYTGVKETTENFLISPRVEPQTLLPRRKKILELVSLKENISLSELKVSFPQVSDRMLRYDLSHLVENGYILKKGKTRAVVYSAKF